MPEVNYNWWEDPKNSEMVERISWWRDPKNKEFFGLPISVMKDGEHWIASLNEETEKYLGKDLHGIGQAKTKEGAINDMFMMIRISHDYFKTNMLNYERWVPFRKGAWSRCGGKWIAIFGIMVSFRYGDRMQGGWYVPFTKLNIRIVNHWGAYRQYVEENNIKWKS